MKISCKGKYYNEFVTAPLIDILISGVVFSHIWCNILVQMEKQ